MPADPAATTVENILSRVRISDVYSVLTGLKPKHLGNGNWRGTAGWRAGDGPNVSMNDLRGIWHDYVTDEGGGVLDLIVMIRGGSRREALHWVAEFAGIDLGDRQMPAEDLKTWREEKAQIDRWLPVAQLWRRSIVILTQETLTHLKASLFDPTLPPSGVGEIYSMEQLLKRLERVEGIELIREFQWWKDFVPGITEALIKDARNREQAEIRALRKFVRSMGVSA